MIRVVTIGSTVHFDWFREKFIVAQGICDTPPLFCSQFNSPVWALASVPARIQMKPYIPNIFWVIPGTALFFQTYG